jgi:hypothetical protein
MAAGDIRSAARLVEGEIVLGCSEPVDECCLYPFPYIEETPFYFSDDLPETIEVVIAEVTYIATLTEDPYTYSLTISETGFFIVGTGILGPYWTLTDDVLGIELARSDCLLSSAWFGAVSLETNDQFSESYLVTYLGTDPPEEHTVYRVSRCRWETEDGGTWLEYVAGGDPESPDVKWNLHIADAALELSKVDDSTPAGTYSDGVTEATVE